MLEALSRGGFEDFCGRASDPVESPPFPAL
jgi:hypothetical protein